MTIYEFADIIGKDLELTRFNNQSERWVCSFRDSVTKVEPADATATGTYGDAKSPIGAVQDYTAKIRGKILVFRAMHPTERQEFNVPKIIKSPVYETA